MIKELRKLPPFVLFLFLSIAIGTVMLNSLFTAARVFGGKSSSPLTIQQVIDATVAREGPGRTDGRWVILCQPGEKDWDCVALIPADSNVTPDNRG